MKHSFQETLEQTFMVVQIDSKREVALVCHTPEESGHKIWLMPIPPGSKFEDLLTVIKTQTDKEFIYHETLGPFHLYISRAATDAQAVARASTQTFAQLASSCETK